MHSHNLICFFPVSRAGDDGSKWEEINPAGPDWKTMAAAAAGGAAVGGATGALLDKKFFNKANRQVPSEYVVIMDRSAEMLVKDTGNPTNAGPPRGVGGAATTLPGVVGGGGATTLPGGGGGGGKFGFTDKQVSTLLLLIVLYLLYVKSFLLSVTIPLFVLFLHRQNSRMSLGVA
jgi:hypothetical protein